MASEPVKDLYLMMGLGLASGAVLCLAVEKVRQCMMAVGCIHSYKSVVWQVGDWDNFEIFLWETMLCRFVEKLLVL